MRLFQEKLSDMAMVVGRKTLLSADTGVKCQYAYMDRMPDGEYYQLPYLEPVEEFLESHSDLIGKRIFLIAEEENIAIKAALGAMLYPIYANKDEIYMQLEEDGYDTEKFQILGEDGSPMSLRLIHLQGEKKADSLAINPFLPFVTKVQEKDSVFFWGLENNASLQDKLDIISGCVATTQFVMLSREQIEEPWVRELMKERDSGIIWIPKMKLEYYEGIFKKLLEDERYSLADKVNSRRLVKDIWKQCGTKFAEEDLAWMLDKAAEKAMNREAKYILERCDFFLNQSDDVSPLDRLQEMTGLSQMKRTALEYAALSQEQMRNPKLTDICKHAIFAGKPGTGKTLCGRLLAQIIAEQGQSNGSFVVAARKDIIGQYLGQTAPKIEKLFAQARNGVLFVDEAGFFLHDTRNSFTQEAIKEFVRYMELYQDVMVIFTLYPHEVNAWLQLDMGLASRIGRIVQFEDYSDDELVEIAEKMCNAKGYQMSFDAATVIKPYIKEQKSKMQQKFGNAREMRKLVESAIIARSIRNYDCTLGKEQLTLTSEDFDSGVSRLEVEKPQEKEQKKVRIGFVMPESVTVNG